MLSYKYQKQLHQMPVMKIYKIEESSIKILENNVLKLKTKKVKRVNIRIKIN